MQFDDRLETVLRLRPGGPAVARIQFRQLLDLLGTTASAERGDTLDAAYARLTELESTIPPAERAAMIEDRGLRLRSPRLVAQLAASDTRVAIAALSRASLKEDQWLDLIPALPVAARGFARHRRDLGGRVEALLERLGIRDRALPSNSRPVSEPRAVSDSRGLVTALPANDTATPGEGIGALVRRIEAFRRSRAEAGRAEADRAPQSGGGGAAPRLPLGDSGELAQRPARAFDFASDAAGRVTWSDPGVAPMVVGLQLFAREADGIVEAPAMLAAAFHRRQPARGVSVRLAGAAAIAGQWQLDASPSFDSISGRFLGYRGRMRRPAPAAGGDAPPTRAADDADRIRQLLHELRTPVNAIQGFAEVIQQQLFGPTPHEYRALAASIVGDSARMLAGFEELDRLARLESGALVLEAGRSDMSAIVAATVAQLSSSGDARGTLSLTAEQGPTTVALAAVEVERLVWRLLVAVLGRSTPGEVLAVHLGNNEGRARLSVQLPAALTALEDNALFTATAADPQSLAAGMFGTGFALRLAAGEARSALGRLEREGDCVVLELPVACAAGEAGYDADNHSAV